MDLDFNSFLNRDDERTARCVPWPNLWRIRRLAAESAGESQQDAILTVFGNTAVRQNIPRSLRRGRFNSGAEALVSSLQTFTHRRPSPGEDTRPRKRGFKKGT